MHFSPSSFSSLFFSVIRISKQLPADKFILLLFLLPGSCFPLQLAAQNKKFNNPPLPTFNIDIGKSQKVLDALEPEKVIIDHSNVLVLPYIPPKAISAKKLTKTAAHRMARWTKRPPERETRNWEMVAERDQLGQGDQNVSSQEVGPRLRTVE